ncbi:hypothetical protein SI859A1_01250 [Aurantimonas manganoxydans SI85-9A1]|uniref:Uncharacterized protein n=1 Tax=Aurantimonas manganoxydans (strain ATCC BAA-1229 / DSM 21871 / SI85-9A1) TaxID=287752 RepID=Q1YJ69_AURMS|nr:hypothetical protein SI859A1_01250 [Aurantimonas manganoxydans SI85-9A1]
MAFGSGYISGSAVAVHPSAGIFCSAMTVIFAECAASGRDGASGAAREGFRRGSGPGEEARQGSWQRFRRDLANAAGRGWGRLRLGLPGRRLRRQRTLVACLRAGLDVEEADAGEHGAAIDQACRSLVALFADPDLEFLGQMRRIVDGEQGTGRRDIAHDAVEGGKAAVEDDLGALERARAGRDAAFRIVRFMFGKRSHIGLHARTVGPVVAGTPLQFLNQTR